MTIYKHSMFYSLKISLLTIVGVFALAGSTKQYLICIENVFIGLFASGALLFGSSLIGYAKEEDRTFREYQWQLNRLKMAVLNFQTLQEKSINSYFEAIKEINQVLKNYFCSVDLDFVFCCRKKVVYVRSIHADLELLNNVTGNALKKLCEFRTKKKDAKGQRVYPPEKFEKDFQQFASAMNNYNDSGELLAIWIEQKEIEYGRVVFGYGDK